MRVVPSKLDNATAISRILALQRLDIAYTELDSVDERPELSIPSGIDVLLRKEVIQPHLPIRLPCYDFTPVIAPTLDGCLLAVSLPASGVNDFRGVTGGVYKARERIHRSMLTCDY